MKFLSAQLKITVLEPKKPKCEASIAALRERGRRLCGKPAIRLLSDGTFRCARHHRGLGMPLEVKP